MILTNIRHEITLKTDHFNTETQIVKTIEHTTLDPNNLEQVIGWYADILEKSRWFGFIGDNESRLHVAPKLNRFEVEDWIGDDPDNSIQYSCWVETTLDNNRAKNPKQWSLSFVFTVLDGKTKPIRHEVVWSRLPSEPLNQNGFEAGLKRRNIFNTLKKT